MVDGKKTATRCESCHGHNGTLTNRVPAFEVGMTSGYPVLVLTAADAFFIYILFLKKSDLFTEVRKLLRWFYQ